MKFVKPGWTKFIGILGTLFGIINCFYLIGLPFAIPVIIASQNLIKAANKSKDFYRTKNQDFAAESMVEYLNSFRTLGIMTLVLMCINAGIFFLFIFLLISVGMAGIIPDTFTDNLIEYLKNL